MKFFVPAVLKMVILVALSIVTGVTHARSEIQLKLATQDFPPFSYLGRSSDGTEAGKQVVGPAADIIHEVCKKMDITYSLALLPWRRAQYDMRQEGLYHGLFLIGKNKSREAYLHFSPPILKTQYGFFVKEDNPLLFQNASDIKGYRVGVFGPSNTSKSLEKILGDTDGFTIDMRPDDISGFKKLSIGRVEAVYSNRDVGFAILKELGIKNVRYAGQHRMLNYYIGFSKAHADKTVVDRFNMGFLELHGEQVIHGILDKYHLEPAQIQ